MAAWGIIISAGLSLASLFRKEFESVFTDIANSLTNDEIKREFIAFGKGRKKKKAFEDAFQAAIKNISLEYADQPDFADALRLFLQSPDEDAKEFKRQALRMFFFSYDIDFEILQFFFKKHIRFDTLFKKVTFTQEQLWDVFQAFMHHFRNAALDEPELRPILKDVEVLKKLTSIDQILQDSQDGIKPLYVMMQKPLNKREYQNHLKSYLEYVKELTDSIPLVGYSHARTDVDDPPIDKLFVPLSAVTSNDKETIDKFLHPEGEERLGKEELQLLRQGQGGKTNPTQIKLNEAIKDNIRLVILGDPGSGKTTILRYAAYLCANKKGKKIFGFQKERVPIFVEFRTFNKIWQKKPGYCLTDYLYDRVRELERNIPLNFFEMLLQSGEAILLFDGLDEVMEEAQRYDVKMLVEQIVAQYKNTPCIVTSRITGYNTARFSQTEFCHVTLLPFSDENIKQFIENWYLIVEKVTEKVSETKTDELFDRIGRTTGTRRLAVNPLMLTIICTIHRTETLPSQRHKLYDKVVESLLYKWQLMKGLDDSAVGEQEKRRRLEYIAFWMHTDEEVREARGEVTGKQLQAKLRKYLADKGEKQPDDVAKEFISHIKERAGLLIARGIDRYAFIHLTFQEYFVAQKIGYNFENEMDFSILENLIKEHLHDPTWQEVILLVIASLRPKQATKVVELVINANSPYNDLLQHDWLFAFRVLGDDVELESTTSERVISQLGDLLKNTEWSPMRDRIFQLVSFLNGTKYSIAFSSHLLDLARMADSDLVRRNTARALGQLGDKSQAIIDGLLVLACMDVSELVRRDAAEALGQLGEKSKASELLLALARTAENELGRSDAAKTLGEMRDKSHVTIDGLLELARTTESQYVLRNAAGALGQLGEKLKTSKLLLALARTDVSYDVREAATEALVN
jgi:energy-coupling factor transporter ATP-binding protein EcfA2